MATLQELANLIFPDIKETVEDLEKKYPKRDLPEGAEVLDLHLLQQDFYTQVVYLLQWLLKR